MGDIFTVEGSDLIVQTLFEKHVFLTAPDDFVARHLAEHLNETDYRLPVYWNGDVYSIPKDYEDQRAAAWGVDKPE